MMTVHVESGRHPAALRRWFPAAEPDPFYDESVLTALYGDNWSSIVIEEDGHALRHAFAASAIGTTGLLDIEPLVGYAGPLATTGAPAEFLIAALRRYSALCRENGIVAELIRFNPFLRNDRPMDGLIPDLILAAPKPVIYLPIEPGRQEQMSGYPRATRNMVRTGYRSARVAVLDKATDVWCQFERLYDRTLEATTAAAHWQLPPETWARLRHHRGFQLIGAVQENRLVAGAIALTSPSTWYYFLAAGVREPDARRGVSNAVVHAIALGAASGGASRLGLGGGITESMADALFAFKNSFGGDVVPFTVGRFTHNRVEHAALLEAAERSAAVSESALFLRYRLAPAYGAGRMVPMPIQPLAGRAT